MAHRSWIRLTAPMMVAGYVDYENNITYIDIMLTPKGGSGQGGSGSGH